MFTQLTEKGVEGKKSISSFQALMVSLPASVRATLPVSPGGCHGRSWCRVLMWVGFGGRASACDHSRRSGRCVARGRVRGGPAIERLSVSAGLVCCSPFCLSSMHTALTAKAFNMASALEY
ncbi:MAG: hypothetical protein ACLT98_03020 [Eggerthellaceae bacterium]